MKAILKNGTIMPKEPFPKEWDDGMELQVERSFPVEAKSSDELDRWMATVQALADTMDPEDEIILEKTVRDVREQARALARKEAEKL